MKSRSEVKKISKLQLNKNWKVPVLLSGILMLITLYAQRLSSNSANVIFIGLLNLITTIININLTMLYINIAKYSDSKEINFDDAFVPVHKYVKCFIYSILIWLFTFAISSLGLIISLLLSSLIPILRVALVLILACIGSIVSIYATFAISLILDKDVSSIDAIKLSLKLVKGSFWKIIILGFSFFGWILVSGLTFGIASIWVLPYIGITFANYYLNLCEYKL